MSKSIISSEVIAPYDDLGTEAVRKLLVKDFPVIVVIDAKGNNLYETAHRGIQGGIMRIALMVIRLFLKAPYYLFQDLVLWRE